jgi:luciferase family oxidoreductase group 1
MQKKKLELGVLDQTPVRRESNPAQALSESVELARLTDRLGFTRYWLSEHHNTGMLAGAAPEVLIARLAAETKYMRMGSGGIMLPNHSSLKVAENFRLLEALYPNRIDLGIGRAPGGDRITSRLLNPSNNFDPQEYIQQVVDLQAFLTDGSTPGTAGGQVRAMPFIDTVPELWMLSSSGESAYLAAHLGIALSYAQFINPIGCSLAIKSYTERFRPSSWLEKPKANVGIFVFCSEISEKAKQVQAVMDYRLLSLEKGKIHENPTFESIRSYEYTAAEWQRVLFNRDRMVVGTPDFVEKKLLSLASEFQVDEMLVSTFADRFEDRLHSYELLAEIFGLTPRPDTSPAGSLTNHKY